LSKIDPEEQEHVARVDVVEIIEARLEEICELVNRELKQINRDGKLPAGVVLTGGGSQLPGIAEFAKHHLRLPVSLGQPQDIQTVIDQAMEPSFATVVGLALWGSRYSASYSDSKLGQAMQGLLENENMVKLKKWFKSFLP
jgi:cell division protein FtsA